MTHDDVPLLADLLPWSVAPLRLGRGWPLAPDAASLKARWEALIRAAGTERARLFGASRSRTVHSAVAQLPGQRAGTGRLARESGPCPAPVRVLHGPFDEQWLIPDHRLIDVARPELWRVADAAQLFAVEQGQVPGAPGPALLVTGLLPDGRSPAGRPGRIRPLYRRPGGREPNLAPGLLDHLAARLGHRPAPQDILAWALATGRTGQGAERGTPSTERGRRGTGDGGGGGERGRRDGDGDRGGNAVGPGGRRDKGDGGGVGDQGRRPGAAGCLVPLTADPDAWAQGIRLGHRMLRLTVRGGAERPKLPGGRRPYVRAPLPPHPLEPYYDRDEETLQLAEGRIAPVAPEAWDFQVSGVPVLERWLTRRLRRAQSGTLEAIGPAAWPQGWTSELLELITVLTLLAGLGEERAVFAGSLGAPIGAAELRDAGVLPVPDAARRPASVLDHHEEGPEGQFALL